MPRGKKTEYLPDPYRDAWFKSEVAECDVPFAIQTDPPEAVFWDTYRLKKTDVKILGKLPADLKKRIRDECFEQIVEREDKPMLEKQKAKRRAKRVASRT
jgi:hypothetical protein